MSFAEAIESFLDPHGFQLTDSKHSGSEKRLYWVGRIGTGRILTTRFTKHGRTIRIIGSAEWRKFRSFYHETTKPSPSQDDRVGTATIRKALRKSRVTITIKLDEADIQALKTRSNKAGISCQRLLGTLITTTVSQ